ncbi:MAG: hypothetical protein D3908_04735 [Candidatus Electrothrix sp. AUS4]|nr:hypothetical protein [Candidatus Electrothrix sp. AUS4]
MRKAQPEDGLSRFLTTLETHTKLLAFFFGLCFVTITLVLAIWFPRPTAFQYTVFRITLALAAAGVAGVIPGMIRLKAQPGAALLIHAGGALAVFVIVYLLAPAALPQEQLDKQETVTVQVHPLPLIQGDLPAALPQERLDKQETAVVQVHQLIQGNVNTAINIEKGNVEVKHEE